MAEFLAHARLYSLKWVFSIQIQTDLQYFLNRFYSLCHLSKKKTLEGDDEKSDKICPYDVGVTVPFFTS
jgi:hypothetical protein